MVNGRRFTNVPGDVGLPPISTIEDEPAPRALNFLDFDVDRIGARRGTRPPGPSSIERQEFVLDNLQQFGVAPSPQQMKDFRRGPAQEDLSIPGDVFIAPEVTESPVFEPGTEQQILTNFAPVQVYQARLEDYLRGRFTKDAPEIKRFDDQKESELKELERQKFAGEIDQLRFNQLSQEVIDQIDQALLASGLMSEEMAQELIDEAQGLIAKGTVPGELPLFEQIQGTTGAKVGELLNQGIEISQTAFDQAQPQGLSPEQELQAGRFAQTQGNAITGTEERDYYGLVQGLGLALQVEQYMMGRFQEFYQQWLQTGPSMEFLQWLRIQMGG